LLLIRQQTASLTLGFTDNYNVYQTDVKTE